tara:strand:- start:5093 stop:5410 length:318 start_codon:yes stop_codon:yes gene_type:complete
MFERNKDVEVPVTDEGQQVKTRYDELLSSPMRSEFVELKEEYKLCRKGARTVQMRKIIMQAYLSDLQDIACDAQAEKDWDLLGELNTIIDSLRTRTSSGFKNRGY